MLAPGKESYNKSSSILKSRDHLLTKVFIFNTMVFPVVMYGCESWTINKAQCQGPAPVESRGSLQMSGVAEGKNAS